MADKQMKRYSTLAVIGEMQSRPTRRYTIEWLKLTELECGAMRTSIDCCWECLAVQPLGKEFGRVS